MSTQRAIKGVLGNFLGTYTSRYSDYNGYWLFGFLVRELDELRIELLPPDDSHPDSPTGVAVQLAVVRFRDQFQKAGLELRQVQEAWLTIRKLPGVATGPVNSRPTEGHSVSFSAEAVMAGGRRYEKQRTVFVAPHDPNAESRCTRSD